MESEFDFYHSLIGEHDELSAWDSRTHQNLNRSYRKEQPNKA